jgi:hypothetical protein
MRTITRSTMGRGWPSARCYACGEAKRNGRRVASWISVRAQGRSAGARTMNSRGSRQQQLPSPGNVPTRPAPPPGTASTHHIHSFYTPHTITHTLNTHIHANILCRIRASSCDEVWFSLSLILSFSLSLSPSLFRQRRSHPR